MKKLLFTFLALGLLYSQNSSAQIFDLEITDYGGTQAFPPLKAFIDAEIQKVRNEINKDLPSAQPERLMEGMANSSVMSGKGIGSDYASNMSVFLIGAGVGVGADLEKDDATDSDMSGVALAPGLVVGANLGFLDTKRILGMDTDRLNMYVNFMSYTHEQDINDEPGKESSAELDIMNLGVHFRYDWIKGNNSKMLGWGGVKFHFGYEYNKNDIQFNSKINETVNENNGSETISGTINGRPVATIETSTHSFPLELSTDVQLLYFLSLYGGVGADINFGSAKGKGDLNAEESDITCTGGNCGVGADIKVQARANIDAEGDVKTFTSRAFAGLQFNLPYVRIFGQVDKSLGDELIGATAGVRFVY